MAKYRMKPVVIEAFRLGEDLQYPYEPHWFLDAESDGTVGAEWAPTGAFGATDPLRQTYCKSCAIITLAGIMHAKEGDYIIKGVNGELYPCKPDIFEKTHEEVEA